MIGQQMIRQHAPETDWSIGLLGLQPTDRVLEIGFGAGRGLELALGTGLQAPIVGVDLSATMIQAAARRNQAAYTRGQLSLLRGDVAALPFQGQTFDKIVSIHTFYFWPDPHATLPTILELLAPGGMLVTTFATAHTSKAGKRVYWPLHAEAETLVEQFQEKHGIRAALLTGPDSRQFNNVAIVIEKA